MAISQKGHTKKRTKISYFNLIKIYSIIFSAFIPSTNKICRTTFFTNFNFSQKHEIADFTSKRHVSWTQTILSHKTLRPSRILHGIFFFFKFYSKIFPFPSIWRVPLSFFLFFIFYFFLFLFYL